MVLELLQNSNKLIDNAKIQLAIYAINSTPNHKQAARIIGITERTLRLWINRYEELLPFKQEATKSKSPYWDNDHTWKRNTNG